jgi:hypothetical protein
MKKRHGGKRKGSGRKASGNVSIVVRCRPADIAKIRAYAKNLHAVTCVAE